MLCRHCGRSSGNRPRGLCWLCYDDLTVRARYPAQQLPVGVPDSFGRFPLPPRPTEAPPGTKAKLEVLRQRAARRCQLWHPEDVLADPECAALGVQLLLCRR